MKKNIIKALTLVLIIIGIDIAMSMIINTLNIRQSYRIALNMLSGAVAGCTVVLVMNYIRERKETRYFKFLVEDEIVTIHATRSKIITDLFLKWDMKEPRSIEITRKEYKELKKIHG